jgi:predicted nucleic acid-binding protein
MFVLDTNILSAIISARPSPELAAGIAGQPEDALFTTTICQAEILAGLAVMPEGRRRARRRRRRGHTRYRRFRRLRCPTGRPWQALF